MLNLTAITLMILQNRKYFRYFIQLSYKMRNIYMNYITIRYKRYLIQIISNFLQCSDLKY